MQLQPRAGQEDTDRKAWAKAVTKLFTLWGLSSEDSLELLGLSPSSRSVLARYRKGEALSPNRDLLERVANLLDIHQSLRRLFPDDHQNPGNREYAYRWMTTPNRAFAGMTPVEAVKAHGFIGLVMIKGYLSSAIGR
jgi:transcriptional regulator with XRE-family HTH domain